MGEGLPCEPTPRLEAQTTRRDLRRHCVVVGRVDDHADVLVVLRRRSHHRGSADVDQLDPGIGGERIQIADDEVDRVDPMGLEVGLVLGIVAIGEQPAVDLRVQRDDSVTEHDRRAGVVSHIGDG